MSAPRPVQWVEELEPAVHGGARSADLLDFSANGNVIGPPPGVARAIAAVDLSRYPDPKSEELRRSIAARDGVDIDAVVPGAGSTELIWAIARAYLGPGHRVAIVAPTYGEYEVASRASGADVELVPAFLFDQGEESFPSDAVQRLRPSICWLCHPNNPTGAPFPIERLSALLRASRSCLFVVDEAYLTLSPQQDSALSLIGAGNLVVLRSLTKDLGLAGVRLGYAITRPDVAAMLRRVLPPWSVSSLAQAAGVAALQDRAHLERAQAAVAESRAHLLAGLQSLGLEPYASVANFVLVSVEDGAAVTTALLERGMAVRDCASFGRADCIRIGVRTVADQERLLGALGEVLGASANG